MPIVGLHCTEISLDVLVSTLTERVDRIVWVRVHDADIVLPIITVFQTHPVVRIVSQQSTGH